MNPQNTALLTLFLLSFVALPCLAQESPTPEEIAEAYYLQAVQQINQGNYLEALDNLNKAIEASPDPIFYCNRGAVLLKLDETTRALESMETCLARLEVEDPAEMAQLDAEVHALRLAIKRITPTGQSIARNIATRPALDPNSSPPPSPWTGQKVAAWSTGIVAAGSLTGALVLELITQGLIDEYRDVGRQGIDEDRFDALRGTIDERKVTLGALVALGGVSALASGLLFYFEGHEPETNPEAALSPDLQWVEGGALLQLNLSF